MRPLDDVARGSVHRNLLVMDEGRLAHSSLRVHHERDGFLMHCGRSGLALNTVFFITHFLLVSSLGATLAGVGLTCVMPSVLDNVCEGDVQQNCDAGIAQVIVGMSSRLPVLLPSVISCRARSAPEQHI